MSNKRHVDDQRTSMNLFASAGGEAISRRADAGYDPQILRDMIALSRSIEGFPVASEESLIKLSRPPYYTPFPNPHLQQDVNSCSGIGGYERTPFAFDISSGKNDPLYFAHYYSTKVPPYAIVPYILHYTNPGDIVFDGFCGTGMVGVAAQLCKQSTNRFENIANNGARRAILIDLSPAATFIAALTNSIGRLSSYLSEIEAIIRNVADRYKELVETNHVGWPRGVADLKLRTNASKSYGIQRGRVEYVVWSDVFSCPNCSQEIVYWNLVFQGPKKEIPKDNKCPICGISVTIRNLQPYWENYYDQELKRVVRQRKQVPVMINYSIGSRRFEKHPDLDDFAQIMELNRAPLEYPVPLVELPEGFNTAQPRESHGFTHVHHFFTRRNLLLMATLWNEFRSQKDKDLQLLGLYVLTGAVQRVCRLNRYMPNHDRHVGPLSGTLYVSQLTVEVPATNYMLERISDLRRCGTSVNGEGIFISTQSATDLRNIANESIDYIFTDPPFGGNLNYSELNILVEAWLGVRTQTKPEAIVNDIQKKNISDYQRLMFRSLSNFYRILKPGRWITLEFHNSANAVWNAIQQAMTEAGFIIADVRTLDKQKGTTKQLSYGSAVKRDLIISAYKPNGGLEERFKLKAGSEEGVWDFVRTHLKQLPVFVSKDGKAEVIAERQNYLLFDRMVAFHVQRGVTVPLSAAEFYAGLAQRFPERDGMYFLPEQVAEYDKKRMTVREVLQLQFFVTDESSAIQWLKQQLTKKPQTFQELHPQFLKEIGGWQKHEKPLELSELLEQNFLRYDGKGSIPAQIVSWMKQSAQLRELISAEVRSASSETDDSGALRTTHPALLREAKDRWYVPDPNKAGDLEKLRERSLLREFEEYRTSSQKRLKVFRLEAVRAGFKKAWQERDYTTIITVARKIPENVLQEDPKLLMWYDQAVTRMGDK